MSEFRFAVNVLPKPGILDPQGRAVEQSLPHLKVTNVSRVRVGRRVELTVTAPAEEEARRVVDGLAKELLSNPLIETYWLELLEATSSVVSGAGAAAADSAGTAEASGAAGAAG